MTTHELTNLLAEIAHRFGPARDDRPIVVDADDRDDEALLALNLAIVRATRTLTFFMLELVSDMFIAVLEPDPARDDEARLGLLQQLAKSSTYLGLGTAALDATGDLLRSLADDAPPEPNRVPDIIRELAERMGLDPSQLLR